MSVLMRVAAGTEGACASRTDKSLWCWGPGVTTPQRVQVN